MVKFGELLGMKVLDKKVVKIFFSKKEKKKERDQKFFDKIVFKNSIFKYLKRCD